MLFSRRSGLKMAWGGSWLPLVLSVGFAGMHRAPIRDAGWSSGAAVASLPPMGNMRWQMLAGGGSFAFGALPGSLKILRSPESGKALAFRALDLVRLREKTSQLLHALPGSHRALRLGWCGQGVNTAGNARSRRCVMGTKLQKLPPGVGVGGR